MSSLLERLASGQLCSTSRSTISCTQPARRGCLSSQAPEVFARSKSLCNAHDATTCSAHGSHRPLAAAAPLSSTARGRRPATNATATAYTAGPVKPGQSMPMAPWPIIPDMVPDLTVPDLSEALPSSQDSDTQPATPSNQSAALQQAYQRSGADATQNKKRSKRKAADTDAPAARKPSPTEALNTQGLPGSVPENLVNINARSSRQMSADRYFLSAGIKACKSLTELQALLDVHAEELNALQLSALITHAAQLLHASPSGTMHALPPVAAAHAAFSPAITASLNTLVPKFVSLAKEVMPQFRARQLANTAWALARLGNPVGLQFLEQQLLPAAYSFLPWFEPQHLSNTLWALTLSGINPQDEWLEEFLTCAYMSVKERGVAWQPQHLAVMLWSLERQGVYPEQGWLDLFLQRLAGATHAFNGQDVSMALVALAGMQLDPSLSSAPVGALTARLRDLLITIAPAPNSATAAALLSDQSLANTLWALAVLQQPPETGLTDKAFEVLTQRAPRMDALPLSIVLWSSCVSGRVLPTKATAALYSRLQGSVLRSLGPQGLAQVLWASCSAGSLQARPSAVWIKDYLEAVQEQLPSFGTQAISMVVYSLCRLKVTPQAAWMSAVVNHFHRTLSQQQQVQMQQQGFGSGSTEMTVSTASPQALANVLWSLAKMGYRINGEGLDVFVVLLTAQLKQQAEASSTSAGQPFQSSSEVQAGLKPALPMADYTPLTRTALNYQELSNVLYALACFGHVPSNELRALLLSALKVQLSSARAQELANTLWSASILQLPLSSSWLASFSAACVEQLPTFNAKDLSQVLYAAARGRYSLPAGWLDACLLEAEKVVGLCNTQDVSNLSWALVQLRVTPSPRLAGLLADRLVSRAEAATPAHLATGVWALGKWGVRLPPRALAVVEAATFRKLPAFQPRELGALLWGLCALGHTPSGDWLEDYAGQVLVKAGSFASQDWTVVLFSLAQLHRSPALLAQVDGLMAALAASVPRMSAPVLATLGYACGLLHQGASSRRLLARCLAAAAGGGGQGGKAGRGPVGMIQSTSTHNQQDTPSVSAASGGALQQGMVQGQASMLGSVSSSSGGTAGEALGVQYSYMDEQLLESSGLQYSMASLGTPGFRGTDEEGDDGPGLQQPTTASSMQPKQAKASSPSSTPPGLVPAPERAEGAGVIRHGQGLTRFTAAELSALLWSAARCGVQPDAFFQAAFFTHTGGLLRGSRPAPGHLSMFLWAAAKLHMAVPEEWMTTVLSRLPAAVQGMSVREAAAAARSLAVLRVVPDQAIVDALRLQLQAVQSTEAQQQQQLQAALVSVPGAMPHTESPGSADAESSARTVPAMRARALQRLQAALKRLELAAQLGHHPPQQWRILGADGEGRELAGAVSSTAAGPAASPARLVLAEADEWV